MIHWLKNLVAPPKPIPSAMWLATLSTHSFLTALSTDERAQLKKLSESFLARKEFSGAHNLRVTDDMAVAIAAQACLPLLHMGQAGARLYDDFTGIVVHPGAMLARRRMTDAAGVVQFWNVAFGGGPPVQVTRNPHPVASAFTWHPDGERVAFAMDNSVCATDVLTGTTTRLTPRSDESLGPRPEVCAFSPTGDRIAFVRRLPDAAGFHNQICVVTAD